MSVEVYTTSNLSKSLEEIMLSIKRPFPINIHIIDFDTIDPTSFLTGKVYYLPNGVFLGALPGQSPLNFSWDKKFNKWFKEAGKHPLNKAVGKKSKQVIDATVGFGNDSCILLALDKEVFGYERNPTVFLCLYLSQKKENFLLNRLTLNFGSPLENPLRYPIYFDPMYDDGTERKTKPSKEMELFHNLIGGDKDASDEGRRLLGLTNRLIVKRSPKKGELLDNVNAQWKSKALRLDLYVGAK